MFKKALTIAVLACLANAGELNVGGRTFTEDQIENFKLAYAYGNAIGGYENTMMGIMDAESSAETFGSAVGDQVNGAFKRSYGIMQVKLGTYYWTMKKGYITPFFQNKKVTEEEILVELITNKSANVYAATGYFKMMLDICGSYDKAISGYNRGHCKEDAKGKSYRSKVKRFVEFSEKHGFDKIIAALIENPTVPPEYLNKTEPYNKSYANALPFYSYDNPPAAVITDKKKSFQAIAPSDTSFEAAHNTYSHRLNYQMNSIELSRSNN